MYAAIENLTNAMQPVKVYATSEIMQLMTFHAASDILRSLV